MTKKKPKKFLAYPIHLNSIRSWTDYAAKMDRSSVLPISSRIMWSSLRMSVRTKSGRALIQYLIL